MDHALLLAQGRNLMVLQHLFPAIFVFCFGGAVGSFINVVNYRLPAGMGISTSRQSWAASPFADRSARRAAR